MKLTRFADKLIQLLEEIRNAKQHVTHERNLEWLHSSVSLYTDALFLEARRISTPVSLRRHRARSGARFLLFLNLSSLITHSEFQWSRSLSHRRPSRLVPRAFPRSPEAALLSRLTSTSARLLMTQEQGRWSLSRCVESLLWFLEDIKTDRAINSIRFNIHITREPRLASASHHVSSESNRRNILIAIWTFN